MTNKTYVKVNLFNINDIKNKSAVVLDISTAVEL